VLVRSCFFLPAAIEGGSVFARGRIAARPARLLPSANGPGSRKNADYFRGAAHVERVRQWRAKHPGSARRKKKEEPLQDFALPQAPAAEPLRTMRSHLPSDFFQKEPEDPAPSGASAPLLQDFALIQDPLFVGLISMLAGAPLQESLGPLTRRLVEQGRRVLAQNPNVLGSRECGTAAHLNSC
jgi:hypothetical protein